MKKASDDNHFPDFKTGYEAVTGIRFPVSGFGFLLNTKNILDSC
jgi:hypothetical protein